MWTDLLAALALVFVIEGILPFLNPDGMRKTMLAVYQLDNKTLRIIGFISMMGGLLLLYLVR
ncbi:MAG: DUF2065 domain-containing protein [Gammaproteobacteria bacterium]|nr:DUF2065 domain-containing protein [Gammaproteobacteria bacterium]